MNTESIPNEVQYFTLRGDVTADTKDASGKTIRGSQGNPVGIIAYQQDPETKEVKFQVTSFNQGDEYNRNFGISVVTARLEKKPYILPTHYHTQKGTMELPSSNHPVENILAWIRGVRAYKLYNPPSWVRALYNGNISLRVREAATNFPNAQAIRAARQAARKAKIAAETPVQATASA